MKHLLLAVAALSAFPAAVTAQNPPAASGAAPAPAAARPPLPADSLAIARRFAGWFISNQADSLFAALPADGRREMGSSAAIADQLAQIAARAGSELSVVEERWVRRNGLRQYWRISRYSDFTDEPVVVRFVIMPDGSLGGIGVNPLSAVPPIDPEP